MQILHGKLAKLQGVSQATMPAAYQYFRQITPIDTGNARNSTSLQNNKIVASYQYASVLDAGRGYRDGQMRGSNQAPQGMTNPTKEFIKQHIVAYIQANGAK